MHQRTRRRRRCVHETLILPVAHQQARPADAAEPLSQPLSTAQAETQREL
jgi:hypothetical protein